MIRNVPAPASNPVGRSRAVLLAVFVVAAVAAALLEPVIGSTASRVISWGLLGAAAGGGLVAVVQHRKARRG